MFNQTEVLIKIIKSEQKESLPSGFEPTFFRATRPDAGIYFVFVDFQFIIGGTTNIQIKKQSKRGRLLFDDFI